MKAALEVLGIPTWHWVTMSENVPDLAMWTEALEAMWEPGPGTKTFGKPEFDNLLGHWGAVTDQPSVLMAKELIDAYPEAKVVLVERDVDRWYKSFSNTVINGTANPFIPFACLFDKAYIGQMALQANLIIKHYFHVTKSPTKGPLGLIVNRECYDEWRENAKHVYRTHNEMIKQVTPKDRLLVFKPEDGWGPLCKHLGKEVPDVPFPRVNETTVVQEKINLYIAESYKRSMIKLGKRAVPVVVAFVAAVIFLIR